MRRGPCIAMLWAVLAMAYPAMATDAPHPSASTQAADRAPAVRNGLDIYDAFRQGLADPGCDHGDDDDNRWQHHFSHAPMRLADPASDVLPLFGYVVDALRQAHLPTEFALIPFVESGYAPAARSKQGPAGLWQLVTITARDHGLRVGDDYDARLSPAASTRAATRYLKTLNGMFGGNWRLAAMAYNAGESRLLQALRRSGLGAVEATPADLSGLAPLTYAYVTKLHALACVLEQAGQRDQWRAALDRPVPHLLARRLEDSRRLDAWTDRNGHDLALLERLNPALANKRWPRGQAPLALVPAGPTGTADTSHSANASAAVDTAAHHETAMAAASAHDTMDTAGDAKKDARTHVVVRGGDTAWDIARRHGLRLEHLLELNGLGRRSVLHPGMVLRIE